MGSLGTFRPRKILIVEDEVVAALILNKRLTMAGHLVVGSVVTGEAAVVAAEQLQPELVLMDILLAGAMDGLQAAQAILAERSVPIIFVTGYDDADAVRRISALPGTGYLLKPYSIDELLVLIERLEV